MKKNLLLVGICLMLTSTGVLASDCNAEKINPPLTSEKTLLPPEHTINQQPAPKQENCTCGCGCTCNCFSTNHAHYDRYKKFMRKVEHHRAAVYNTLNLTEEQIKMREELLKENTPVYKEKFEKFIKESQRLKSMKAAEVSEREINKQRHVVVNIKKDIDKTLEQENKTFRKCLTKEQRAKYDMIKKLERRDFKHNLHKKDLHKSNPRLEEFGKPACKKSCPIEQPCDKN